MVLQEGMSVPVWGWADEGEEVVVSFSGKTAKTKTKNGKWMLKLGRLKAGGPDELIVEGKNRIALKNVLVGEVWICSGQSNMEWPVSRAMNSEQELAQAQNSQIRFFTVKRAVSDRPLDDVSGNWAPSASESVKEFSAVGYFFGREI